MKSVYCIAITACLTVIWLYEEKKKRGMAGKLCWKAAAGYLITRFVFFAISVSSFPVKAYLLAFTVSFNVTKDFFGPGTAPLTRIRLFSTSTLTISRF